MRFNLWLAIKFGYPALVVKAVLKKKEIKELHTHYLTICN